MAGTVGGSVRFILLDLEWSSQCFLGVGADGGVFVCCLICWSFSVSLRFRFFISVLRASMVVCSFSFSFSSFSSLWF
jgi:hypothetical protein